MDFIRWFCIPGLFWSCITIKTAYIFWSRNGLYFGFPVLPGIGYYDWLWWKDAHFDLWITHFCEWNRKMKIKTHSKWKYICRFFFDMNRKGYVSTKARFKFHTVHSLLPQVQQTKHINLFMTKSELGCWKSHCYANDTIL